MNLQMLIRYVGFGQRCKNCGKLRETTKYTLRHKDDILQEFQICDACQDKGFLLHFNARKKSSDTPEERKQRVRISKKLEQGVALDLSARRQPGSGNGDSKDDIRKIGEWRIEHKYTDSIKGYRIFIKSLAAVIRHANLTNEFPALVVNFRKLRRKFTVIPYELFLEIVEELRVAKDNQRLKKNKRSKSLPAENNSHI